MRLSTPLRGLLVAAALVLALPAARAQTVTIAAARTAGVGATVTVEGVVSRAKGFLTQFQDATGGLSLRQTAGGFFDAVTAGTIAPGTTIRVTGVLSQFRGLLQINQGTVNDLTAFTVVGQGAAPVAQVVTLAQLAASGETYESELVVVRNVTTGLTGTFAAATNVPITDPSDASGAVVLRIANAGDTDVDGTAIPAGPFSVTAVVGQFDTNTPAVAFYQLLPVLASDIAPGGTSTGETPDGTLSLAVANPVRGAAQVRFSTETAQDVRVTLFDALGRQVATVAQGVSVGAQTATLDAAGLAPGVYVLRLTAGAGVLTQTVTVVR